MHMANIPVALQMYTLRNESQSDFVGTLKKVSEMGYQGVELAGTGGIAAAELRMLVEDLNLDVAGSHVGLERLEGDLQTEIEYNITLGNRFIVCPYLGEDRRRTADGYRQVAESLNQIGQVCQDEGIQLCYHNHAFEFQEFEGRSGLDILLSATFPDLVALELDTYWVEYGGKSAVDYLERYAGRVPLVHLKDMTAGENRTFAEVGAGTMNWAAITDAGRRADAEWFIVEQDTCQRDPLTSVRMSLDYLRSKGWA
jgi:sugar phosphate isomerase/epimerase